ncbi:MAG: uncharacterized protein A8A55_0406 [Amphiamblys sp. WSBS2006]|nr:MAG: uncharacterized protein A8A55_0406 [Amphiamblys sp. WSBS2006]
MKQEERGEFCAEIETNIYGVVSAFHAITGLEKKRIFSLVTRGRSKRYCETSIDEASFRASDFETSQITLEEKGRSSSEYSSMHGLGSFG